MEARLKFYDGVSSTLVLPHDDAGNAEFWGCSQQSGPTSNGGPGSTSESPMSHQSIPSNESQAGIPEISTTSKRPVQIKNVTVALADEGGAALFSEHSNIKLFKLTTYVFAARETRAK